MSTHRSSQLRTLTITLILMTTAHQALAQPPGNSDRKGPPAEAITACEGLAAGASCEFSGRGDDVVKGVCASPPHDKDVVACKPEGGRPSPSEKGGELE